MTTPEQAPGFPEVVRVVAPNPGPMTLAGTNTYIVGRDPAYVIDPGPQDARHIDAIRAAADDRGGIAGVLLTHSHFDHSAGVAALGAPLLWGRVDQGDEGDALAAAAAALARGEVGAAETSAEEPAFEVGPFTATPTPGHATDHVAFAITNPLLPGIVTAKGGFAPAGGGVVFCGDLILGKGSSIVPPAAGGGSLPDYLRSLERLAALDASLLAPGHGPWITDPAAKIAEYTAHRLDRERKLLEALEGGERSREALLDAAWSDVPPHLRIAAALAMQAQIEKLTAEGRMPPESLR